MIQTLFILNSSGTIVMRKDYRGHSSRSVVDFFWDEVCRAPSPVDVSPVLTAPRNYLFHVYRGGLFYLAPVAGKCSLYNHCYIYCVRVIISSTWFSLCSMSSSIKSSLT